MEKKLNLLKFLFMLFGLLSISSALGIDIYSTIPDISINEKSGNYHIDNTLESTFFFKQALELESQDQQIYHVFSHGKPGQLLINGKWLHAKEIAIFLRQNMTPNTKEIYIYGCNFARGEIGKEAVAYLEQSLDVNISASNNITGINGDWVLENNSVDMKAVFAGYQHNLQDSDGDLINDDVDLDDDNDGILDVNECPVLSFTTRTPLSWTISAANVTNSNIGLNPVIDNISPHALDAIALLYGGSGNSLSFDEDANYSFINLPNGHTNTGVLYDDPDDSPDLGQIYEELTYPDTEWSIESTFDLTGMDLVQYSQFTISGNFYADDAMTIYINNNSIASPSSTWYLDPEPFTGTFPTTSLIAGTNTIRIDFTNNTNSISGVAFNFDIGFNCNLDTDGDGIVDRLDLDSDNDGCADFVEGGGSHTESNGEVAQGDLSDGNNGLVNTNLGNTVNTSGSEIGVPTIAGTGQTIGASQDDTVNSACTQDTDGDGIADVNDIDSDNDGIPDDLEQATAGNGGDTDGDGIPDYLDLDSDNDGIPDLIEAGGTDTDGDGLLDDACVVPPACTSDTDGDGLMDSVDAVDDTSNPSPTIGAAGTLLPVEDTDSDGKPDFQDLDADNDGINDIEEAGITDTDNDGIVDNVNPDGTLTNDADGDGFTDSLDPNNGGTAGTPGITTDPDADADGLPDDDDGDGTAYNADDTDGDGTPDFQDLDSDNDGILDIVEGGNGALDTDGDGTLDADDTGYADTDGDGIPDPLDQTPNDYGDGNVGNPNSPPTDTDNDNVPDYQDLDSDNDSINDVIEGGLADPNGDGLVDNPTTDTDGDGIPDSVDGAVGFGDAENDPSDDPTDSDNDGIPDSQEIDSDNDGTFDIVDSDNPGGDSTADGDNDGIVDDATDTDGDGIADVVDGYSGFGDLPETCGSGTIEYALTDGTQNTTGYQWDNSSAPGVDVPSTQLFGLHRSTTYCESGGWRHYHNSNEPDKFLFSVEMGANTTEIEYIELRVAENPESLYDSTATNGFYGMPRDWHVKTVGNGALTAPVNIRFYYVPTELKTMLDRAIALSDTDPSSTAPTAADIVWFKKDNYDPANDINPDGTTLTGGAGYTVLTPQVTPNANGESEVDNSTFGNGVNFVQFNGITGFSGGSAFVLVSGVALPVELSSFEARKNDCDVNLTWETQSENNFDYFEIQWSGDGHEFSPIKIIAGEGGTISQSYSYTDERASENNYYRLKMVDLDGSKEYSKVIFIDTNCGFENDNFEIYPNPISSSQGILNVEFYTEKTEVQLFIVDILGRTVKRMSLDVESNNTNYIQLDISNLPSGTYSLQQVGTKKSSLFIIQE
ncbi:MAG: DUF4347 domain-containing protein [Saprospiraceae bacterium]